MKYAKIENDKIVQIQPNKQEGFTKVGRDAVCGMVKVGEGFVIPERKLTEEDHVDAVQRYLDTQAQSMGYDNIFTAVTYADEPAVEEYQLEGQALRAWRSRVWAAGNAILQDIKSGKRDAPTIDELIAELPKYA